MPSSRSWKVPTDRWRCFCHLWSPPSRRECGGHSQQQSACTPTPCSPVHPPDNAPSAVEPLRLTMSSTLIEFFLPYLSFLPGIGIIDRIVRWPLCNSSLVRPLLWINSPKPTKLRMFMMLVKIRDFKAHPNRVHGVCRKREIMLTETSCFKKGVKWVSVFHFRWNQTPREN